MNSNNCDVFTWDDSVCSEDRVFIMGDSIMLYVDKGGFLNLLNYENSEECTIKKEWINFCSFSRPKLFFKGGFSIIWNDEASEVLTEMLEFKNEKDKFFGQNFFVNGKNKIMGFGVEPPRSEKELFDDIEDMVRVLKSNGVKFIK